MAEESSFGLAEHDRENAGAADTAPRWRTPAPRTAPPADAPATPAPPALSRRALSLGLFLVVVVATLTPYNDFILSNAPFIGNHLPIGIMTILFSLVLVVNPALQWLGKRPFSQGELVVILTMMLVAAAAPSSGLMRYLEPMIVTPYWHIQQFPWLKDMTDLLPAWLMPATDPSSTIISNYWLGIDPVQGGHTPIMPFLIPQLIWGVLVAAIMGSALFLAAIFRRQWVHHERLTYPLATIPLELMSPPEPGRFYNTRWRNPLLWAGAAVPLFVYFLAGMHAQFPGMPTIDLQFNLHDAFTDRPWDALPSHLYQARLYFAAVGICFFIPSEVAFSLWLFVVVDGMLRVFFARTNFDPGAHENERSMGTYVMYFAGLLWLARGHLRHVVTAAWKKAPRAEDEPITYRAMVWGWLICIGVAWAWLMAVGMNWLMALLLLGVGTMLVTLMARIVAETGLFFVNVNFWPRDLLGTLLGKSSLLNARSYLWSEIISGIFYADFKENLMPFATNTLRMGQEIPSAEPATPALAKSGAPIRATNPRTRWFKWLIGALATSIFVSGMVNHFLSYHYGRNGMNDYYASFQVPHDALQNTYARAETSASNSTGDSWENFGIGSVSAIVLMAGRVMWAGWPFHPIGLLLMNSSAMKVLWFSIFFGWAAKVLLLRYGGAGAFKRARPFFIGLIVGEVLAAGIWMFIGLATNGAVTYTFLPR